MTLSEVVTRNKRLGVLHVVRDHFQAQGLATRLTPSPCNQK
jgi:hypothetical protein